MFHLCFGQTVNLSTKLKVCSSGLFLQVVVQRVHVDGLSKTKEDLLTHEISGVFRAKNLIEVGTSCPPETCFSFKA